MKTSYLSKHDFENILDILLSYTFPGDIFQSYDKCAEDALKYIKQREILNDNVENIEWLGEGYRLLYNVYDLNACKSIYITPDKTRIIYEGIVPWHYINELRFADCINMGQAEIDLICKKYKLISKAEIDDICNKLEINLIY